MIRVIENEEELQNALSPGALKLEILEKTERKTKNRERELKETNNKLKIKIEEYNKKTLELQNLLTEVGKYIDESNYEDNADYLKNKIDKLTRCFSEETVLL